MEPNDETPSTRYRVIEVAAELFANRGFTGTTIRQICAAAKITPPTLYYHFGSKSGLFEQIVSATLRDFMADTEDLDHGQGLEEVLTELAARVFRFAAGRPATAKLIAQLDLHPLPPDMRADIDQLHSESMRSVCGLFEEAKRAGELPDVDARYCGASFVGLTMFQLAARSQADEASLEPADRAARRLARFVVAGARGAPRSESGLAEDPGHAG